MLLPVLAHLWLCEGIFNGLIKLNRLEFINHFCTLGEQLKCLFQLYNFKKEVCN